MDSRELFIRDECNNVTAKLTSSSADLIAFDTASAFLSGHHEPSS